MPAKLKVSGSWRTITQIKLKVNGAWRNVTQAKLKVAGAWKTFFLSSAVSEPASTVTISQSTDFTTKLVTLTGTNRSWSPVPDSLSYYFQWYDGSSWINISTGIISNPSTGSTNTKTYTVQNGDNQILPNQENLYRFVVQSSYNGNTNASTSSTTSIQTPRNISNLTAVKNSSAPTTSIDLSWSASLYANNYKVYYKAGGSYSFYVTTSSTSLTVTGLVPNTTYTFKIIPITGNDSYAGYTGNDSNEASATTDIIQTPQSFNITGSSKAFPTVSSQGSIRSVSINWDASTNATLYRYQIESSSNGSTWSTATTFSGTSITYANFSTTSTSVSISPNYAKFYRVYVRAYNDNNDYIIAANAPFMSAGTDPSGLTVTAGTVTTSSVSISWTLSSNGSNFLNNIQYSTDLVSWTNAGTSTPFTISGLTSATSYTYYFRALNEDGLTSEIKSASFTTTASAPTIITRPTVSPSSGTAGSTQFTSTTGSWNNSPTSYSYQWKYNDQGSLWVSISGATSSTYTPPSNYVTTYGTGLRCYVTATNSGGDSVAEYNSNTVTVSAPVAAPTNSSQPTLSGNLTVGSTVTFGVGSWTGSPTSYDLRLYRGTQFVSSSETLVKSAGNTTSSTYTITQADYDSGQRYLRAFASATNSGGTSSLVSGQEIGPITLPAPSGTAPAAPGSVTAAYSSGPTWALRFNYSSSGTQPITYNWYFYVASNSSGSGQTLVDNGSVIAASYNNTYTIGNRGNGGTGYVWGKLVVTASNGYGSATADSGWN